MINLLIDNPGTPDAPEGSPTEAEILARLAACTRDICADCGCEEYCVDYLRARLADFAATLGAPDPLETLPSAWQMSLVDLKAHDLRYTARLMNRDDLTREERQHWGEVVENIERHNDARRWIYQRPY